MAESNAIIHIVNSALYRLGESPITSLEEGTEKANVAKELYPDARDTLLSWQAWPFATVRGGLSRLVAAPPSDYQYYYQLPTIPAVMRLISINDMLWHSGQTEYQREIWVNPSDPNDQRAVLATDAQTVVLRYVGQTIEGVWPGIFVNTLAVYLAQAMAPAITGKASLKEALLTELYGTGNQPGLLIKMRDIAGYEDSPRGIPMPDSYILARQNGGGSASRFVGT